MSEWSLVPLRMMGLARGGMEEDGSDGMKGDHIGQA